MRDELVCKMLHLALRYQPFQSHTHSNSNPVLQTYKKGKALGYQQRERDKDVNSFLIFNSLRDSASHTIYPKRCMNVWVVIDVISGCCRYEWWNERLLAVEVAHSENCLLIIASSVTLLISSCFSLLLPLMYQVTGWWP